MQSTQTHVCLQGLAYVRGHLLRDGVCKIFQKASRQVILVQTWASVEWCYRSWMKFSGSGEWSLSWAVWHNFERWSAHMLWLYYSTSSVLQGNLLDCTRVTLVMLKSQELRNVDSEQRCMLRQLKWLRLVLWCCKSICGGLWREVQSCVQTDEALRSYPQYWWPL